MPLITLNDGKQIKYEKPVTGDKIAKDISPSLFKKSLSIHLERVKNVLKILLFMSRTGKINA